MIIERSHYSKVYKPEIESIKFFEWLKKFGKKEENKTALAHYQLMDHVFNAGKNVVIECTRGLGKSTLVSEYLPLYIAMMGELPHFGKIYFAIFASDTEDQAKGIVENIYDKFESNDAIKSYLEIVKKTTTEIHFKNNTGHITAMVFKGTGQKVRGIKRFGMRPDLIIADDILSEDDAKSKVSRDATSKWFFGSLSPAVNANRHKKIVIGTPLHDDDVVNKLINSTLWSAIILPAAEAYPVPKGERLLSCWEDRFTEEFIREQHVNARDAGEESLFFREYMLQVVDEGSQLFPPKDRSKFKYHDMKKHFSKYNFYTAVDLAISEKESADYTVIMTIAVSSDNTWFIVDIKYGRWNPTETIDNLFQTVNEYDPLSVGVEVVAFQKAMKHFIEKEMITRNKFFRIEELKNTKNKELRISGLEPRYRLGKIKLASDIQTSAFAELNYEMDMATLEGVKSKHDDMIDCLANFIELNPISSEAVSKVPGANKAYRPEFLQSSTVF